MIRKQHSLEGSSIFGHKLQVEYKGDGILSSSFVIERNTNTSAWIVSLVICLFCVATALYKELLLVNHYRFWTVVVFTVVYTAVCLRIIYFSFCRESVLIVKDLGVHFTRSGLCGIQTMQFIEQHEIVDVLINEAVTMHQVVFYLTLLTSGQTEDEKGNNQQLIPLFTASMPCLETIKPIYHGMQQILKKSS